MRSRSMLGTTRHDGTPAAPAAEGIPASVSERAENFEVARLFEEIARSLDVKGEQGHRPRAYRRAARGVAGYPEALSIWLPKVGCATMPGHRPVARGVDLRVPAQRRHAHPHSSGHGLSARAGAAARRARLRPAGVQSLVEKLGVTDLDSIERPRRKVAWPRRSVPSAPPTWSRSFPPCATRSAICASSRPGKSRWNRRAARRTVDSTAPDRNRRPGTAHVRHGRWRAGLRGSGRFRRARPAAARACGHAAQHRPRRRAR